MTALRCQFVFRYRMSFHGLSPIILSGSIVARHTDTMTQSVVRHRHEIDSYYLQTTSTGTVECQLRIVKSLRSLSECAELLSLIFIYPSPPIIFAFFFFFK